MNMNRMNLGQLVNFFASNGYPATSNYFAGCVNDSVTEDGWIEEGFVKAQIVFSGGSDQHQLWREIQSNVTTAIGCEEFKFTFETEEDLYRSERTGYIDAYDCVRIEVKHPSGGSVDFPVKSRDEYKLMLKMHKDSIVKIYPTVHSYDILDYA